MSKQFMPQQLEIQVTKNSNFLGTPLVTGQPLLGEKKNHELAFFPLGLVNFHRARLPVSLYFQSWC